MVIEDLKALLEAKSGVVLATQRLLTYEKESSNLRKALDEYEVEHNEAIHMQQVILTSWVYEVSVSVIKT
ncbi:hypothetical protein G6F46_009711 [Rhizopus delemar]|uniref:Uncharacterized protein n=2 Tax=Rhizopus TaxID=4842 RepID=A0A9P7CV99_9FUNG|nr:hypothetical protein G6F55_009485 [Rhizopus delemar]KAG1553167.1 hypothetical protein G6F51_000773 [Rhizopus arrhizus]KAG1505251.1 hypothetical protein G6F54_000426 [Rhizopus delemar]KAG1518568.1 hypothetical protein G6F53_000498 [Rhizopus delemar]KAG1528949.1 hypothetical protein G6F52_000192 [Rhizopus delemar]